MKIAIVAPSEERIPPVKYGGTELVIANLAEGLVKAGHEVDLFASGDSTTIANLRPTFPYATRKLLDEPSPSLRTAYALMTLGKILPQMHAAKYDIVHNHLGWMLLPLRPMLLAPIVTTIHGPYDVPFATAVTRQYPDASFVSISEQQAKLMSDLNYAGTVYNGIQVEKFKFNNKPKNYFAFLGRFSPEKGPKEAIMAAKAAGVKLVMAGKIDIVDKAWFEKEVEPLIDGKQITFIGEVDHAGKVELLRNARALLMLIQWDEPFGLVMTESMACGTPVIAIPRGSVPEIVIHGKSGLIVENTTESAADAIKNIDIVDRAMCRKIVEEKFSAEAMVQGYVDVYKKVIKADSKSAAAKILYPKLKLKEPVSLK